MFDEDNDDDCKLFSGLPKRSITDIDAVDISIQPSNPEILDQSQILAMKEHLTQEKLKFDSDRAKLEN